MIIMALLQFIFGTLKVIFGWLNLPDMPIEITSVIDEVKSYIIEGLPIVWCFFDKKITTICLGVSLAAMNFEKIYYFLMWILSKLPIGINKN